MELGANARVTIAAERERVWEVVVANDTIPLVWKGRGPIPGSLKAEVEGGGPLRPGATRLVHNTDGSVVHERILELQRPSRQAYELVAGLKPPFTWMVKAARGEWDLSEVGNQTEVVWRFHFTLTSPLAYPFATGLARGFGKAMQEALERLKAHLER
jgi:uncharacterized protein YndB with AHSA1/START domain